MTHASIAERPQTSHLSVRRAVFVDPASRKVYWRTPAGALHSSGARTLAMVADRAALTICADCSRLR